ncbi:MAG: aspartate kinase [Spirochaetales bacterium]|jgi:aspartokinase/homoserine dehydrogenase 1|nr:aspartate kinase [Spirochaetales bacterium]
MKVMKFGGSSVQDADRIRHVISIVQKAQEAGSLCVVFSAMRGVTDDLIKAALNAQAGRTEYRDIVAHIRERQTQAVEALFPEAQRKKALEPLHARCGEILDILHGIELVRECTPRSMDLVMSFGERLNCRLIASVMRSMGMQAVYFDARSIIVTDGRYGSARVDFKNTYKNIRRKLSKVKGIAVVTGFIAAAADGVTTTLGRNGSDYTAALLAAGLGADSLEVWKDVDGVLSADPAVVKDAFVIDEISYEEAMEMSFFGAEVIHPYTMGPVLEKNIPLWVRNTLNPAARGTRIARDIKRHSWPITGIASIENVALINVEGSGMQGTPGIASRVFSALAKEDVNVIMISQASSEHSICIVCRAEQAERALAVLKAEFAREIETRQIENFELAGDLEIIAIIGENMRGTPGISGRLFSALGEKKINVLAIAQGSSERNISFVVDSRDRVKAINTVHRAFFSV